MTGYTKQMTIFNVKNFCLLCLLLLLLLCIILLVDEPIQYAMLSCVFQDLSYLQSMHFTYMWLEIKGSSYRCCKLVSRRHDHYQACCNKCLEVLHIFQSTVSLNHCSLMVSHTTLKIEAGNQFTFVQKSKAIVNFKVILKVELQQKKLNSNKYFSFSLKLV